MARWYSWLAAALAAAVVSGPPAWAQRLMDYMEAGEYGMGESPSMTLAHQETIARASQASVVIVEYQLQYDKGDAPRTGTYGNLEQYVVDEMPLERWGMLADARHVVTADMQIQPRFVKSIKVRAFGGDGKAAPRVGAGISAYPKTQNAVILELEGALAGTKPAEFDAQRAEPYVVLDALHLDARWGLRVQGMPQQVIMSQDRTFFVAPRGLVLDKAGGPVGMVTGTELPVHGEWKGSPLEWPAYSAAAMKELLGKVEARAAKGIVPVTLNFRATGGSAAVSRYSLRNDSSATVQHTLGVVTGEKTVLVLGSMKPSLTARLERIRLQTQPPMDATFKASLLDFGAMVVETDKALSEPQELSPAELAEFRQAVVPSAEIRLQGEDRVVRTQPRRIASFSQGPKGQTYPDVGPGDEAVFLFDPEGRLLALPLPPRQKAGAEDRYSSARPILTPVALVRKALVALKENSDPNNVPLSEDQQARLAWTGLELQPLTPDLARMNHVADETNDGRTGGLVTYIYPNSPAAKAGVQLGWIMLRLNIEGQAKPMEVQAETDYSDSPFPWEQLGTASETVFDQIPTPWPNSETLMLRTLTDVGFGKKFTVEFSHDQKVEKKDFVVEQGPPTYNSAAKYKHAGLGLTVKDMTYEVRRYLQKKDEDPGVIVSKIELGSKASVAGLKPYEVITHVNDQPVLNVKDFETASKDQTDLRLSVKRMAAGRIVKVTLPRADAAGTQPQ